MGDENEPPDRKAPLPPPKRRRIGFMEGEIELPDDFDTMYQAEIEEMFYGSPIEPRIDDECPTPDEPRREP